MEWIYTQPVRIVFGSGSFSGINDLLSGYNRPLIVCQPFFIESGIAGDLRGDVFSQVSENPDVSEVNACSEIIRKNGNDVIIALGGGSTIDLAKAASVAVEDISEFHGTGKPLPKEHLPLIAVPTTSGTGSEVTCVSVLTDRRTGKKAPLLSESFYAETAVVDPLLTLTVPQRVTAATGMDVLCHAVEGYWSKGHQPVTDALALYAASLVLEWLPRAFENGRNTQAREKMAEASLIAGLAFNLPKTTGVHACSFPLTSIYGISHGEACALTLDGFILINSDNPRAKEISRRLGFASPTEFAQKVVALKSGMNLLTNLKKFNLSQDDLTELVKKCRHPNMLNNPVDVSDDMLNDLFGKMI